MWPRIRFDPVKLFDLHVSDLLYHDEYYIQLMLKGDSRSDGMPKQLGEDFFVGLQHVPEVLGYLCECCPEIATELRQRFSAAGDRAEEEIRNAEHRILEHQWNLGMTKDPSIWDALPWSYWDPNAIYDRVDINGKIVLDIGAGTGQVSLRCVPYAGFVYALEPVARLRRYIECKLSAAGFRNFQTLKGVLAKIPLSDDSVDVGILSSGSFGWYPEEELQEIERVICAGGSMLMLAACTYKDKDIIALLKKQGYEQFEFALPTEKASPSFIKRL